MRRPEQASFDAEHATGPAQEWAALAPLLAAQGRARVSRDGGHSYPTPRERPVPVDLPNQPTAVRTYGPDGCASVLCFDLDTKHGDVVTDYHRLTRLLSQHGMVWFADESPSGGRHVYAPLARPAPLYEVKAFLYALESRLPTLDKSPMLNIVSGCIRPPGSRHGSGGWQRLLTPLDAAVKSFATPSPQRAWDSLRRAVIDSAPRVTFEVGDDFADAGRLRPISPSITEPDGEYAQIARTGDFPSRYKSSSEARQGVLWACVSSGMSLADVWARIESGAWAGLASFYAKYRPERRRRSLMLDWREACAFEERRRAGTARKQSVHGCNTSQQQTHRAVGGKAKTAAGATAAQGAVRSWLTAVDLLAPFFSVSEKAVLYALAQAAMVKGRTTIKHGCRSLALATGMDASTVARALQRLREAPADRLLIAEVAPARGVDATEYALVVPPLLEATALQTPWRRGKIYSIRPVFRELGMVAAFVHMVVERGRGPVTVETIMREAGVSRSGAYEALACLTSWGLVRAHEHGWVLGATSLEMLAERFGVAEKIAAQLARYEAERIVWWTYLGLHERVARA